jgi:hypothetical protein
MQLTRLRVLRTPVDWIEGFPFYVVGKGILEAPPSEYETRLLRKLQRRGLR